MRAPVAVALAALGALAAAGCGAGGGGEEAVEVVDSVRVAREVTAMLRASARSWNVGDLDGFLDDYLDSPETTFVGGAGVVRGRDEVRARYEASYWAPGAERDSLRFEELEVRPLGTRHALTLGRYVLYRPPSDSVTATGRFTLVLRREDDGWKILHDHSS